MLREMKIKFSGQLHQEQTGHKTAPANPIKYIKPENLLISSTTQKECKQKTKTRNTGRHNLIVMIRQLKVLYLTDYSFILYTIDLELELWFLDRKCS